MKIKTEHQKKGTGTISYIKSRNNYRVFAPTTRDPEGKVIRKNLGSFPTYEEALKTLNLYTHTIISSSFSSIIDIWYNDKKKLTTNKNSLISLDFAFNSINKLFSSLIHEDIKKIKIKDLQFIMNNSCYSYSSLLKIKTYLYQIFDIALMENIILNNYINKIKIDTSKGTNKDKICDTYTIEDINLLFKTLSRTNITEKQKKYIKIMLILLYTGIRKEELFHLEINLDKDVINVLESKTSSGIRIIPIHKRIKEFLELDTNNSLLILNNVKPSNLNYNFDVINKSLGINVKTVHDTRKSFTTRLNNKNNNIYLIAKLIGHTTRILTVDTYTKPDITILKQVIESLD